MILRPHLGSTRSASRIVLLALMLLSLLLLGRAPNEAAAGLSDYPATLYFSGAAATHSTTSNTLLAAAGPGQPAGAVTLAAGGAGLLSGLSYAYSYTLVDATGGETPPNSPAAPTIGVTLKTVVVSGLPTGVTVRLYRKGGSGTASVFRRVATLTNNASASYTDNMDDVTAGTQPTLPQAQNRPNTLATGYYEFAPGSGLATSAALTTAVASPAFTGKGWLVDGQGSVSIPTGTWTFTTTLKGQGAGTGHLVIGMWKVNDAGAAVGSPIIDPATTGENLTANISTAAGTAAAIVTTINGVAAISLAQGEHLYVQFWRRQTVGSTGTPITTLYAYDGVTKVVHPAANGFPTVPVLASVAARVKTTPQLSATYSDPDADTGTVSFQLCSDSACGTVLESYSSASGIVNNAVVNWTPTYTLVNGTTYYWRVSSLDSTGNLSGWSPTSSFKFDTTAPNVPALGTIASRVNATPQLSGTFSDADSTDTGTVSFQLCADSACSTVRESGASAGGIASGASGTWTPSFALVNGTTYYWRSRNTDLATNVSSWSTAGSFVFDTTAPNVPTLGSPADAARVASSQLSATYTEPDVADTGTVTFQLCADAACSSVTATSTSSVVANNASASWTPSVADGVYYWRARAQDVATNASAWSASRSLTLDTTVPDVPTLGTLASRLNTTPQLSASFTDADPADTGAVSFQLCSNSTCSTVLQSVTVSGVAKGTNGTWTPTALSPGLYYWRARVQDLAANASAWSAAGSFTIDTTAPSVPALGTVAARVNAAPQLSATLSDAEAADTGTLSFQLCTSSTCATVLQSGTSSVVASGASGNWTPSVLADGVYYWRARAQDIATNTSAWSTTGTFTVDTTLPSTPALSAPADGAALSSQPWLNATFTDSAAGDSGIVSFQVCSDAACSGVVASGASATLASGGSGSWHASALADGSYYARARAQDAAGNVSSWSSALTFTLDTGAPAVPVLAGIAPGTRTAHVPSLVATYSDPGSVAPGTVTLQVCSTASCTIVVASTALTGVASGTTSAWSPSLSDGAYYWRARAQDAGGNQSAWSSTVAFAVDTTAPPAPSLLGVEGVHAQSPPVLTARLGASDPGDGPSLVTQVCTDPGCANVVAVGYASGSGSDVGWQWQASPPDGVYYWRASAQDVAGNQSGYSGTRSFVIDRTAPDVPVLSSPAADAIVARATLSAGFHSSDATDSGTLAFQVCVDASCAAIAADGVSGLVGSRASGSWTVGVLSGGSYFWRAQAVDVAGNASAWSSVQAFTLDTTPPGKVREFKAGLAGSTLTLRWKSPADGSAAGGYALFVGGAQARLVDERTLTVTIRVRADDRRSFSVAAIDVAGNVGSRTRAVVLVPQLVGLTLQEAKQATSDRRVVFRTPKQTTGKPLPYVVAQAPESPGIVDEGSVVTVVAGVKPVRPRP